MVPARYRRATEKWKPKEGGRVVEQYTDLQTGKKYVLVEWSHTPGQYYAYFA